MKRTAKTVRKTKETDIKIDINLDGQGQTKIQTGMGFFNHMLESLAKHAGINLKIEAKGDLDVDYHHTVEDVGIVLGETFKKAMKDKKGIERFGFGIVPMDESLAYASLDLSGRPYLIYNVKSKKSKIVKFDLSLIEDFFRSFAQTGQFTLHIKMLSGENPHHIYEAVFKAVGRALKQAIKVGRSRSIPSTKGVLE